MAKKRISAAKVARLVVILLCIVGLIVLGVNACHSADDKQPQKPQSSSSKESGTSSQDTPSAVDPLAKYAEYDNTTYATDVSQYLEYIEPRTDDYLFLVNPSHTLAADYVPPDLTDCIYTRKDGRVTQQLRLCAAKALEAFLGEGKALGKATDVTVTSAYRSYDYQRYLFNFYCEQYKNKYPTREEVEKYVLTFSTRPGTSEHQSGLCMDMHNVSVTNNRTFASKPEAKWLADNCYRFGFILRYPEDKTDITGIIYEPWHFRFVGRYHATRMHELGLSLEEYIAQYTAE